MEIFTSEQLKELLSKSGQTFVSIYMPTHRVGRAMQQDPIRFKNMLSSAKERLEDRGLSEVAVDDLLKPAQNLLIDGKFWQHQSDGLALFIGKDFMKYYRLPLAFEKLLVITNRFHLKPLMPLLSKNGRFFVLALSQNKIRLLEGNLFSIDKVNLENVPTNLREALRFDDHEKQLQFHTGTTSKARVGGRPSVFHGQGASADNDKTDLLRYFQQVDNGLIDLLGNEDVPLVLAGVDYLLPIYQKANSYPYLVEDAAIIGNPDELSAVDLHQQAWKIVEQLFVEEQNQALARYEELSGPGNKLASSSVDAIIPAAHYGRIAILLVALGAQNWGIFEASTNNLEEHREFHPGDQDLLDLAAMQTVLNGGVVYTLEPGDMPDGEKLAAIFRFTYNNN